MRKNILNKSVCIIVMMCMLFIQIMFVVPTKVEASVNTENEATIADLFTQKTTIGGQYYEIFRIPGIVVTQDGTLIAYCEARKTTSDWADIDILMVRSTDNGQTWSAPSKLVDGISTQNTMNNPVMIAERDTNTVHFLFSKEYAQTYHLKSTDGGLTWTNPLDPGSSAPVEITGAFHESTYDWRVIAVGPGHGIQLDNGRLLASVWMANGGAANPTAHSPSVVSTIYSDDYGVSWHIGEIVAANSPELSNPNESALVQLADGSVMINMRNNDSGNRRAVSISPDGISNWSTPVFDDELVDPLCFGSIVRYSKAGEAGEAGDKNRILFVNDNSETAREHLTLRMSEDEGQTWKYSRLLQLGGAAYSDIAVGPDKSIYVFYEREPYKYLTVKKFGLDWLTSPPPMAQLNHIAISGADFAPSFISEIYAYDVRVDANLSSINITPTAYPNSSSTITINGQPANSGEAFEVPLPGDSAEILVTVTANGQSNTYTLRVAKKRLVTNWKFEKSVSNGIYDSSGFGNSTATTFRGVEYEQGYIGKALKFDDSPTGTTTQNKELLDIAGIDATKFGTGDFSVSTWINADDVNSGNGQHVLFWYGRSSSDISQWWVRTKLNAATGTANLEFSTGNKPNGVGSEINAATSDAPIKARVWQHIVTQRKNGVMEIYVDGVRKTRKGSTPLNISRGPETNLYIGRAKSGDRGWHGKMDEIRMYNYGLNAAEIQALASQLSVDSTALDAKITEAKALNEAIYTSQSWANLQAALAAAEAELDSDGITQGEIDQAQLDLQAAITALVLIDIIAPTASVSYSNVNPTNQDVVATITPSEPVTIINNGGSDSYVFSENGSFTFEFMDAAGNTGSVTASVSNIDRIAPTLRITLDQNELNPPNHKLVPIHAVLTSEDNNPGTLFIILQSITSNEPDNGLGDGDTPHDILGADFGMLDTDFELRAERSGKGNGRIYTITYTISDAAGNQSTAIANAVVNH
ncbi:MAG: hypothetical protein K0Q73_4283 [Paenibacillus sp.]|nr:hypothetical protein [Paenibacillus sp.]